jgi:hypothetical protein
MRPEKAARKISSIYASVFLYYHWGLVLQNHIAAGHSSSESEFEAPVPVCTDDGAECIFCDGLFSQEKFGEGRFQCTGLRSGVIVTAFGTERILIPCGACALIVENIPGSFMLSYYAIT